jgi:hypothetical protein
MAVSQTVYYPIYHIDSVLSWVDHGLLVYVYTNIHD